MKNAVTLLPMKFSRDPFLLVDELGRIGFHFGNEVGYVHCPVNSDKQMDMIGHSADG